MTSSAERRSVLLRFDPIHEGAGALERVRAAVGFVAAHEGLGASFQEDDAVDDARSLELLEGRVQGAEEGARTHVDSDREPVDAGGGIVRHHAHQGGKHRRGQVVDDVPVEVLQRTRRSRAPSPRVSGDDEDLVGGARLESRAGHVAHGDPLGERGRVVVANGRGLLVACARRFQGRVVGHGFLLRVGASFVLAL